MAIPGSNSGGRQLFGNQLLHLADGSVCMLVAYIVTTRLPFGRHVYAIGGNERAAELSGCALPAPRSSSTASAVSVRRWLA
jgi:ribose/xylose/arabinose/galactoside ABC-type transport system permease subunit